MSNLALIKKLREATGCGIADCNKALAECKDDYDSAVDWLRKKGLSSAAKKSERVTTEGLVGVKIADKKAVIVEVNSETDFVAKNERFQNLVDKILDTAINVKSSNNFIEDVKNAEVDGKKLSEVIADNVAVIGENLQLRRIESMELQGNGEIVSYIHTAAKEGLGKIAVLVALQSNADKELLKELGKKIAMHIAASKPEFLNEAQVPAERLEREKAILMEQSKASGKPQNIIEKMIEGRIKKFYEEICLLDQAFVMDDKMKVADLLTSFKKENGADVSIMDFRLFVLGEGLEKKSNDFASEVASMTK